MSSRTLSISSVTSQDHLRGQSPDSILGRSPDSFYSGFWPGVESGGLGIREDQAWSENDPVPCDMNQLKRAVLAAPEHEVTSVILGANMRLREQGFTALIQLCGKRRQWNRAIQVFNALLAYPTLDPNTYSYSALISALSHGGQQQMALYYFDQQLNTSKTDPQCLPNQHTYSSAITACERAGLPFKALEVYEAMKTNGVTADNITYSAILTSCQKHGLWQEAANFIDQMELNKMPPSLGQYHTQLRWYGNARNHIHALDLFLSMQESGQQPTLVTCQIALEVFQMCGQFEFALNLLDEMLEKQYQIDITCFNIVLRTLYNCDRWEEARNVYDKLIKFGLTPNNTTAKYILGVHQIQYSNCNNVGSNSNSNENQSELHDEWLANIQEEFDKLGLLARVDEEGEEEEDFFYTDFFPYNQQHQQSHFGFENPPQFPCLPPPCEFLGYPLPFPPPPPLPIPYPYLQSYPCSLPDPQDQQSPQFCENDQ